MIKYNALHNLANAIILRAVADYRTALKGNDEHVIYECERFFRSEWFMHLTNIDGEFLIEKLRKEADE